MLAGDLVDWLETATAIRTAHQGYVAKVEE